MDETTKKHVEEQIKEIRKIEMELGDLLDNAGLESLKGEMSSALCNLISQLMVRSIWPLGYEEAKITFNQYLYLSDSFHEHGYTLEDSKKLALSILGASIECDDVVHPKDGTRSMQ